MQNQNVNRVRIKSETERDRTKTICLSNKEYVYNTITLSLKFIEKCVGVLENQRQF
jgi:hypothetical protein